MAPRKGSSRPLWNWKSNIVSTADFRVSAFIILVIAVSGIGCQSDNSTTASSTSSPTSTNANNFTTLGALNSSVTTTSSPQVSITLSNVSSNPLTSTTLSSTSNSTLNGTLNDNATTTSSPQVSTTTSNVSSSATTSTTHSSTPNNTLTDNSTTTFSPQVSNTQSNVSSSATTSTTYSSTPNGTLNNNSTTTSSPQVSTTQSNVSSNATTSTTYSSTPNGILNNNATTTSSPQVSTAQSNVSLNATTSTIYSSTPNGTLNNNATTTSSPQVSTTQSNVSSNATTSTTYSSTPNGTLNNNASTTSSPQVSTTQSNVSSNATTSTIYSSTPNGTLNNNATTTSSPQVSTTQSNVSSNATTSSTYSSTPNGTLNNNATTTSSPQVSTSQSNVSSNANATQQSTPLVSTTTTATSNSTSNASSTTIASTTALSSAVTIMATTAIPIAAVPLEFKITGRNFSDDLKNKSSPAFQSLKQELENELSKVYKAKFNNFKRVVVTDFSNGSVVVNSTIEFESQKSAAPSSDNTVRALISSVDSNSSFVGFQLSRESVKSDNISLSNLPPLNVSVKFLIKTLNNESEYGSLRSQTEKWVQDVLLKLLSGSVAANASISFANSDGWTSASGFFIINSTNLVDETATLQSLIDSKANVSFSIVPRSLTVQEKSLTFNVITTPLKIMNIPQSTDVSAKSSAGFQTYAKAIEDSFRDIYGKKLVEPVVTGFTTDSLFVIPTVDLYFQDNNITKAAVIQDIVKNETSFRNRNVFVNLFELNAQSAVLISSTLTKTYTSSLSNSSSAEASSLASSTQGLVAPVLKQYYNTSLVTPPSIFFKNVSGSAAVVIQYLLTSTVTVTSSQVVRSLLQDPNFSSTVLKETLLVNNVSLSSFDLLKIPVNFVIKTPYNASASDGLKQQTVKWVQSSLLSDLNGILATDPAIAFTDRDGWTLANATFSIYTLNKLDVNTTLNNLIASRGNASFSIVPGTLKVQETSLSFNVITPNLRILNIPSSVNLSAKSSSNFQTYAKSIEDSFKDIFGAQLVEPVVYSFTLNGSLNGKVFIELYFQNTSITQDLVTQKIIANEAKFRNRNLIVDLILLSPTVAVQVQFTFLPEYYLNASSLQTNVSNWITPVLQQYYKDSLQTNATITTSTTDGSAILQYKLNYTIENVNILNIVKDIKKTDLTSYIRIVTLSVNNVKDFLEYFTFQPRFINTDFTDDLKNINSATSKALSNKIITGFGGILKTLNVAQLVVVSFAPGSVIGNVELTFPQGAASPATVGQELVKNRAALLNLNLDLDPKSVYGSYTTFPPPESSFPGYAVAIIVMCILAILCIPLLIFLGLRTNLFKKLCNACSLKPPYDHYEGSQLMTRRTYKTHAYELR